MKAIFVDMDNQAIIHGEQDIIQELMDIVTPTISPNYLFVKTKNESLYDQILTDMLKAYQGFSLFCAEHTTWILETIQESKEEINTIQ